MVSSLLHPLTLGFDLPEYWARTEADIFTQDPAVSHAPKRVHNLTADETKQAIRNALRYFDPKHHARLAPEFLKELNVFGHIYMYRFRPTSYEMKAYPIEDYPGKSVQAKSIMLMIMNNLDKEVAQYPHELITYGGTGSVFSNWAQYHLTMKYLSTMTDEQTLVMYSGHPHGLFPSHPDAPRAVVTNGMVIPNYSSRADYDRMYAMGVSQYGQMTAGSYCYIGPQGIVHGTTLVCLNAGRKYTGSSDLRGKLFVTAGLGGMSGAQPKAGYICKLIAVVAEVDPAALNKRYAQGWVTEKCDNLDDLVVRIKRARVEKKPVSIGYLGNVVDIWERLAKESETDPDLLPELGSDQTSLHIPFTGGYYPVGLSFEEGKKMIADNPAKFKELVEASLRRHVAAVNKLTARGMAFFDYGNAFLLEASRAKADILNDKGEFKYPSYVQDIMGDIFSLGFGPFRWVCTSGLESDLETSDRIAEEVLTQQLAEAKANPNKTLGIRQEQQVSDNHVWIRECGEHKMVVGSQARILYANAAGRSRIALALNKAIADGRLKGPVMLSRDHHDVSGTDSPYRETSNVTDGSKFTADMAVHNFIGDAFRGATSVSAHNGGGVGWGEVFNGGFLLLLDGSDAAARRAKNMLFWDVNNGITRRSWAGNENANLQIQEAEEHEPLLKVTLPAKCDDDIISSLKI
ncbi:Urocanate hydratase [Blastocladiella emersonii ATCC 22665]|nr:Urocanate hydratase [Blastocladiella emersonii ATCC 22665]